LKSSNAFWNFFISVRLTIVLLLSLAATSIIGTLIPQNQSQADYFNAYGEVLFNLFTKFDIFDMYHSWWFQLLILMLGINILACSIDRLSLVWKTIFVKNPKFNIERFRKLKNKETFIVKESSDQLKNSFLPEVSKAFGYTRMEETDKGACIFAEKYRWTRLGVYVVHLSVLFLLAGSLLGSIFGFDAFVNIPEGESVNTVHLRNSNRERPLGFEIRCDDFEVTLYKNGAPKEYRSSLTILEDGKTVLERDIIVNDPLHYKGINIFQSSYGKMPTNMGNRGKSISFSGKDSEAIDITFRSSESGMAYSKKMKIGETVDLPEGLGRFGISEYRQSAEFRGHNIGEALVGKLSPENGDPVHIILPLKFPNFDKMRGGKVVISISGHDHDHDTFSPEKEPVNRYYTGLQVTKDPGVWIVYSGFILMIVGCIITFFMSHQRICVEIEVHKKKTSVIVTGSSNKNRFAMENKIKKIAKNLEKLANHT
jgi:cytochrome c biogenesis protein